MIERNFAHRKFLALHALLARFGAAKDGAFAVVFALMALPLICMSGATVEYASLMNARAQMINIIDLAVIAAVESRVSDGVSVPDLRETIKKIIKSHSDEIGDLDIEKIQIQVTNGSGNAAAIQLRVDAALDTSFLGIIGIEKLRFVVSNSASAAREERVLDLVMCIDATGSMQGTIDTARSHALNLDANLKAELARRGLEIDSIRARVIFYRDFGGPQRYGWIMRAGLGWGYRYQLNRWIWNYYAVPHLTQGYGYEPSDFPVMSASKFFDLTSQRQVFRSFLYSENAHGGWNWDEAGLECVNEAMGSKWRAAGSAGEIVMPVIVVWTDAPADYLGDSNNIGGGALAEWIDREKNECAEIGSSTPANFTCTNWSVEKRNGYPTDMPRNLADMTAKWNDPDVVGQGERQIILFGPLSTGWSQISGLSGFQHAGSISTGTANFVTSLADAIASGGIETPRLTR